MRPNHKGGFTSCNPQPKPQGTHIPILDPQLLEVNRL